ncbi:conserved hypothetical protein [Ferroglobus placidus DSM 10642]|uniref:Uncharacterized protein n=1 Tax=Ferroglobus placidus (strain DSM 10642 / AEDII12DO) TaxID=589924 RepID=D3S0U3_FERPA|nr:hypothetical protein [Ferroglobus placidus]ADC66334.1 conserved hypothetical protein [Ferroglobus placidus DSM 10642]
MRKALILLILAAFVVLTAGCAEKSEEKAAPTPKPTPTEEKVTEVEINVSDVEGTLNEIASLEKELANLENITFEEI